MPSYEQVHLAVDRIPPGPWVYARLTDDYGPNGPVARDGSIVEVIDRAGRFCGHALYNSTSDIRLRMLSRGRKSDLDRPRQHLQRLIAAALRLRRRVYVRWRQCCMPSGYRRVRGPSGGDGVHDER